MAELVGDPWVLENVRVENHFARDDDAHIEVGVTSRGTVACLDRRFVEADIRIATGLVEPHFMAGYSGGRKVITPGVAHAKTITRLHTATYMEDPKAAIDDWQTEMQLKPMRRGKVHLFTKGLSRQQQQLTGVAVIDSQDELIRRIAASLDRDRRIAVIPEGPYILPQVRQTAGS